MLIASRIYAFIAYAAFTVVSLWGVLFLVRQEPSSGTTWSSAVIDVGLWVVFALQHSVMARPPFKAWLTRFVPEHLERSTFVLAGSLALGLVFWQWRALPGTVWEIHAQPWAALLWIVYGAGWLTVVATTHMIDHAEFTGLKQPAPGGDGPGDLSERWLYGWVRHPMMTGLLVAFWVTPVMTVGHLVFALAGTVYIAVGVHFEERALRRIFGVAYDDYARRVPRFVPRPGFAVPNPVKENAS